MNEVQTIELLRRYADKYNDMRYFEEDPIIFPKHFAALLAEGKASLQDVETAAAIAAHLAWGRRSMIVRDCTRAMEEMGWQPYEYVRTGSYRDDGTSLHRTVKWSEFAAICRRIKEFYDSEESMETLSPRQMRGDPQSTTDARKDIRAERRHIGCQQEDTHAPPVDGPRRRQSRYRVMEAHR